MENYSSSIFKKCFFVVSTLGFIYTLKLFLKNLFSVEHFYIVQGNISSLKLSQTLRNNFTIKLVVESDWDEILKNLRALNPAERKEILVRLFFYQAGLKNCYIIRTKTGEIAAMQWLICPSENSIVQQHFNTRFYPLKKNQVMIENVYTFPTARGIGSLPAITTELLRIAKEKGFKSVVFYVSKDKIAPLNEFIGCGCKIRKIMIETKILGRTKRNL